MGEVVPSRAFLFFGSFNSSTAYPEKRGFSLNAPKSVFPWWVCSFGVGFLRGVKFPPLPPKPFFNGANKATIFMGVNRKHPLLLMIAP